MLLLGALLPATIILSYAKVALVPSAVAFFGSTALMTFFTGEPTICALFFHAVLLLWNVASVLRFHDTFGPNSLIDNYITASIYIIGGAMATAGRGKQIAFLPSCMKNLQPPELTGLDWVKAMLGATRVQLLLQIVYPCIILCVNPFSYVMDVFQNNDVPPSTYCVYSTVSFTVAYVATKNFSHWRRKGQVVKDIQSTDDASFSKRYILPSSLKEFIDLIMLSGALEFAALVWLRIRDDCESYEDWEALVILNGSLLFFCMNLVLERFAGTANPPKQR